MASKSQRKRAEKRKKARNRGRPVDASTTEELPRPLRLIVENYESLVELLTSASGPNAAKDSARAGVRGPVERMVAESAAYDVFDVVQNFKISESANDPETYRETEHDGLAAAIELSALVLGARGTRHGSAEPSRGYRARPDPVMDDLRALAHEALDAGSKLLVIEAITSGEMDADLAFGAVLREVFVRNLVYPHMLEKTLDDLFDDPLVESDCRVAMNCSVSEVRAVIDAISAIHNRRWKSRGDAIRTWMEFVHGAYQSYIESARAASLAGEPDPGVPEATREEANVLMDRAWAEPANDSLLDIAEIASEAGLAHAVVAAVVDLFAFDLSANDPVETALEFLNGRSPLRVRPILRDPDGSLLPVHEGLLLPAVRERVEEALKLTPGWSRYSKRRGEFLEKVGLDHLASMLPGATSYSSIEYFVPDPTKTEATPPEYTKLVEGDGLLVLDEVAVILEAKGGALNPESRAGDHSRLRSDLRKLVSSAADQATRMRDRIRVDRGLRLRDGTWLDLRQVRETHMVAVTLEDLSSIATVTAGLIKSGLVAASDVPWVVSLHDLQIIRELVDRPAEFVLYLRRRTEPTATLHFLAVDELDLFLEFFATGLYVEPDPRDVRNALPHLGEPSVAELRRFKDQGTTMLTSRTDQLDAWYFHMLGLRTGDAPKPSHNAHDAVQRLVDALAADGSTGWLTLGATLLGASSVLQRKFANAPGDLAKLTRRDGRSHSYTMFVPGSGADSSLLVWVTPDDGETPADAAERLRSYVAAKKHQMQAAIAAGLVFDPRDLDAPPVIVYDSSPPGPNPELDVLVADAKLRPAGSRTIERRPR